MLNWNATRPGSAVRTDRPGTPLLTGLDRVRRGIEPFRIVSHARREDPITCHRTILVCRHLRGDVGPIHHILEDGGVETHADAEARLLSLCGLAQSDLFRPRDDLIEQAYAIQGDRIAYVASAPNREDGSWTRRSGFA